MKKFYTEKKLKDYAQILIDPLMNGYSASLFSLHKVGASLFVKYLLKNIEKVDKKYSEFVNGNSFIWIELNQNIDNPKELLIDELNYYLNDELQLKPGASWKEIEKSIELMIGEKEPGIVFVIDNASLLVSQFPRFAYRLMSLNRSFFSQLLFLFISVEEIPDDDVTRKILSNMYPLLMHNINYFPLFDTEDMALVKENTWRDIGEENLEKALSLSSGVPGIFRVLQREQSKKARIPALYNEFISSLELRSIFFSIWSAIDDETQDKLINNDKYTNDYLLGTGLKNSDGSWGLTYFEEFVSDIRLNTSKVNAESLPLEQILTYQELLLFNFLYENKGRTVSRDEIAKIIWKDLWIDKYSDWAIAKLISQLRKKTSAYNGIVIKTVQNEGFMLL